MAQPTDQSTGSAAPTREDEQIEPLKFTLSIISPSVSVPSPLTFPQLLATTTVKDLKSKIRDVLPSKPADEHQRLIHRGRLLGREMETMEDVFGKDTVSKLHSILSKYLTNISCSLQTPSLRLYILYCVPLDQIRQQLLHLLLLSRLHKESLSLCHPSYNSHLIPSQLLHINIMAFRI